MDERYGLAGLALAVAVMKLAGVSWWVVIFIGAVAAAGLWLFGVFRSAHEREAREGGGSAPPPAHDEMGRGP